MSWRPPILTRLALGIGLLGVAAITLAQTYGLGDQVLSLGFGAFHPPQSDVTFHNGTDGYLYSSGGAVYETAVVLPEGAVITQICVYANVTDAAQNVSASLDQSRLLAGGQGPPQWGIIASATDDVPIGYGVVCSDLSYEVHNLVGGYNVAYDIYVNANGTSGFGGVRLTWHRQVSLPPATPSFADVQPGDFGFQQIEALVASGVTGGCGGGNFSRTPTSLARRWRSFSPKRSDSTGPTEPEGSVLIWAGQRSGPRIHERRD